jgi:DNA topoisomerase-1
VDSEPVTVQNGRYGPYVKRGAESRSLESEDQMFTITLDEAKELLAQPKPRGRAARAAAAPPLKELGEDPVSGKPIVLREGRFGPYVTDGETNASLRKGDTIELIAPQRAVELLAERRAAAPAAKRKPAARAAGSGRTAKAGTAKASTAKASTAKAGTAKTGTAKTGTAKGTAKTGRGSKKAAAGDEQED